MSVRHDACTAAHVRDFAVVVARTIEFLIERCVEEAEIREEAFCTDFHRKFEYVIVRVILVVIHALFDLEYLHGEDRGLTVAKACIGRLEKVDHDHPGFGRCICTIVYGAEWHLRAGTGIHRVEIMDEGFHRLIGGVIG